MSILSKRCSCTNRFSLLLNRLLGTGTIVPDCLNWRSGRISERISWARESATPRYAWKQHPPLCRQGTLEWSKRGRGSNKRFLSWSFIKGFWGCCVIHKSLAQTIDPFNQFLETFLLFPVVYKIVLIVLWHVVLSLFHLTECKFDQNFKLLPHSRVYPGSLGVLLPQLFHTTEDDCQYG